MNVWHHCRGARRDTAGWLRFRSSSASIGCTRWRAGTRRTATGNSRWLPLVLGWTIYNRLTSTRRKLMVPLTGSLGVLLTAHNTSSVRARDSVWIVTVGGQAASFTCEGQTVRTGLENRLVVGWITFVVVITIFFVRKHRSAFALARPAKVDRRLGRSSLGGRYSVVFQLGGQVSFRLQYAQLIQRYLKLVY